MDDGTAFYENICTFGALVISFKNEMTHKDNNSILNFIKPAGPYGRPVFLYIIPYLCPKIA
jgi:hypothetical protein